MTTTSTSFNETNNPRSEQASQQADIAAAMRQAADLGPQVLALQQSLLEGIGISQKREAERLAKIYEEDNSRIADARTRFNAYTNFAAQVSKQAVIVGRFAETFQQNELFHGYVNLSDGTAAVDYVVQIETVAAEGEGTQFNASAKTDSAGYFRIDLRRTSKDAYSAKAARNSAWLDVLAQAMALDDGMLDTTKGATADAAPASAAVSSSVKTRVHVLDGGGRVVFEDPAPPEFGLVNSDFRFYVLGDSIVSGSGTATKVKSK